MDAKRERNKPNNENVHNAKGKLLVGQREATSGPGKRRGSDTMKVPPGAIEIITTIECEAGKSK